MEIEKRTKKPNVKPEQRQNWLERNEKGESVPRIAESDDYDERTIRRHIELARQQREAEEARSAVLRNALERHYEDICNFTERLNSRISGSGDVPMSRDDDLLETALRQHLARSPIWGHLLKWQRLQEEIPELREKLDAWIKDAVESNPKVTPLSNAGFGGIVDGVVNVLIKESEQWLNGNVKYSLKDSLGMEPTGEGLVSPHFGFSHMGVMNKESANQNMNIVRGVIGELEINLRDSEEYHSLEKKIAEMGRLSRKLRKELAVIRLRRIVPGRCRFCPL